MIEPLVIVTFFVALTVSVLSGMAGAGGALVFAPYLLLIGLPPTHALATQKLIGIGVGVGSISKFYSKGKIDWKWVIRLLPIGVIAAVVGS